MVIIALQLFRQRYLIQNREEDRAHSESGLCEMSSKTKVNPGKQKGSPLICYSSKAHMFQCSKNAIVLTRLAMK
uniref:Ovule protein n=1 Tax=Panagrellus redivivus TaxID=6233 RepID=A0A7E4VPQ0_PANRE